MTAQPGPERSSPGPRRRTALQRKASLSPAGLHRKLSVYAAALSANTAKHRRRFSQVGYAVSARLGWRITPSKQEIIEQAKIFCGRYIRARLRYCAVKTIGLQRLKSVSSGVWLSTAYCASKPSNGAALSNEEVLAVGAEVRHLGMELERSHPKLFASVTTNVGLQALNNESAVQNLFQGIAKELFRSEVNWGRVVALYAVSGALALDCVRLGKPELVMGLVEVMGSIIDRNAATWIALQGGWISLLSHFKPETPTRVRVELVLVCLFLALAIAVVAYIKT